MPLFRTRCSRLKLTLETSQEFKDMAIELSMSKVTVPKKTKLRADVVSKHRDRLAGKSRVTKPSTVASKYGDLVTRRIAAHKQTKRPTLASPASVPAP